MEQPVVKIPDKTASAHQCVVLVRRNAFARFAECFIRVCIALNSDLKRRARQHIQSADSGWFKFPLVNRVAAGMLGDLL